MRQKIASIFALLVASAAGVSCGGKDTEMVFVLEADDGVEGQATKLHVRVFDNERELVVDQTAQLGSETELPRRVPLYPEGGDASRTYHLLADIRDGAGELLGRQRAIGGYVAGESKVATLRFEADCRDVTCAGNETCVAGGCVPACLDVAASRNEEGRLPSVPCPKRVWVDGDGGEDHPDDCYGPEAPCASIQYAADKYAESGDGPTIHVRGGIAYGPVVLKEGHSGGPGAPLVIRPWPQTGMPRIEARGERSAFRTCCGAESASHFVLDGLEIVGGVWHGVQIHGEGAREITVRNCLVHDNGEGIADPQEDGRDRYPTLDAGILVYQDARDITIDNNVVRDNRDSSTSVVSGILIRDEATGTVVTRNRVLDNEEDGIRANKHVRVANNFIRGNGDDGLDGGATFEHNVLCNNAGNGIEIKNDDDARIVHNTVVGSGEDGLFTWSWAFDADVRDNIFAYGKGSGIAAVLASDPVDHHNLFFANEGGPRCTMDRPLFACNECTADDAACMRAECGCQDDTLVCSCENPGDDPGTDITGRDPLFRDLEECDLALANDSPARGAASDGLDLGAAPMSGSAAVDP